MSKNYNVLLAYGDIHLPSTNRSKLNVLEEIIKDTNPDILLDGGDFLDGDSISSYNKSYEKLASLQDELDLWDSWAKRLNVISPKSRKILLKDNHFYARLNNLCCDSYWMTMLHATSPASLLNLSDHKWEALDEYVWKDTIVFIHGDQLGGSSTRCPINKSRTLVKDMGYSVVKFHSHTTGMEVLAQSGKERIAIQIGAFQDPNDAGYIKHPKTTNWTTSAGIFYLSTTDSSFQYTPIIFMNGSTVVNGKIYTY